MNKLIRVSGRRLLKSRVFYIALAVTLLLSLYLCKTKAPAVAEWAKFDEDYSLEDCYYELLPLLGLVQACFVSLFLGTEHSDGTLRNKLIAGHSRSTVFISLFLVSALGCALITLVWLLASLPGLFWFNGFACGWKMYGLTVLLCFASSALYAAIYSSIVLLIPNKAVSAVTALVLWFVMLFVGSAVMNILQVPEMTCDMMWVDGVAVAGPEHPNPNYVRGVLRSVIEAMSHIIPTCPLIGIALKLWDNVVADIVWTVGVTLAVLGGGCAVFRKKDLK